MYHGLADSSPCTELFDLSPSLICLVNSATLLEDQFALLEICPPDKIIALTQRSALVCSAIESKD